MDQKQEIFSYKEENNMLSFSDLLYIIKINWYWFVFSVIICLSLAFLYVKSTPKIYTRTASVLIKDNSSGSNLSQSSAFEDLHLFDVKRNVDNEIFIFKSKQLMLKVARRLNLNISYIASDGLRKTELYTRSPIIVSFPDASETDRFSFAATPISENEVQLSDFSENKGEVITVNLSENDTITASIGKIVVIPSIYYGDKYFDVPITITKSNLEDIAQYYSDILNVTIPERSASIIRISLNDISIPRNEDIINTAIAVYNEEAISDKNQIMISTSEFINERLIIIEKELGNVDADIETFKRENRLTDIHSETDIYLRESSLFSQEAMDLQNQRTVARHIRDYLMDPRRSSDAIPANTISDVSIEGQISEYNSLLLRRNKLISNSSDRNPVVLDLNNSLTSMKQTIIRAVENLIHSLDIKIRNIRERESQTSKRISAVPTQQKYVLSVERQQKIKESLYLYLLNKREENALSQAIIESDARIIDPAKGAKKAVSPKTTLILLAALLAGIAIPAAFLWLQAVLNTTVRNRKDVEDALSIPFLGDIPLRKKNNVGNIVVRENSREPISEAFRIIRTNMDFMRNKNQESQVIMITSFNPGAGKTFVSTNLAMSMALTQKKVILLDLDIRKGTLSSHINISSLGITNFLSGKINDINEIINKNALHETLDFIPAGPVPPNPSELLLSDRLDILIQNLKKHYDYVILDNAPSNVVADATIINRVSDLTIYIIRADKMDRRQLPELEKLYLQKKYKNMGIILNGVNYKKFGYGYYGYYGYYEYNYD